MFRLLVLFMAVTNVVGNVLSLLLYRPILAWVGAPLPIDTFSFTFVCAFSFAVGVLAWIIYRDPEHNIPLLIAVILGKAIYASFILYFYDIGERHWFYLTSGVWDAVFTVICFLFLIRLLSPDLTVLDHGQVLQGGDLSQQRKKAVILYFSMSGNGARAVQRVQSGLVSEGYTVEERPIEIEPREQALFRFPFQHRFAFLRIMIRAILRIPVKIQPIGLAADHDFDLIVVESQTWFVGMSAPVEAVFRDPANHAAFAGRDVAVINVCRGLWRRPQAMLVRWVEACGGRVVGTRAFTNPGRKPIRTFSLVFCLGASAVGRTAFLRRILTPQFLSSAALADLERFGKALAQRPSADRSWRK
ncbi:MAG TPA: hypothetical protein VH165_07360 [Kofleriaceae bacterium]|jgi:hypothetical protein|nr:hypothetical protein [Kofleriaceae bacterium]